MRRDSRRPSSEAMSRLACETAVLINEAIADLLVPQHLRLSVEQWHSQTLVSEGYAGAMGRLAAMGATMALYRLEETRADFLLWLFDDSELRANGFVPVAEFVSNWDAFLTVRGQYVGHSRTKQTHGERPGNLIRPERLGRALREAGLWDQVAFLTRVREDLVPAVERVRDELFARFPEARTFCTTTYPEAAKRAAEGTRYPYFSEEAP